MKPLSLLLLLAFTPAALAQHDAHPPDVRSMLQALEEYQTKNSATKEAHYQNILRQIHSAAGSNGAAVDFYEKAVQATQFSGKNLQQTLFQEWKKKEAAKLKSVERQTAARLHLQYLGLTLRKSLGAPIPQLLPELIAYTSEVLRYKQDENLREPLSKEELFRRNVTDGIFADWLGIKELMTGDKEWEGNPSNVDGIYQKTILPAMRAAKDPNLLRYWDARMALEEKIANDSKLTFNIERFQMVDKPALLWSRAQEVLLLGQPNHAINEMFALIKRYPDHPDNAKWIEHLGGLLAPKPKE